MVVEMAGFCERIMLYNLVSALQNVKDNTTIESMGFAYLGDVEIPRQKTPIDVSSVSNIRIVIVCSCLLENLLHKTLGVVWLLEEQFDHCRKDLQLRLERVY